MTHSQAQLEMSFTHTHHKADELSTDKDKLQEQWLQAQTRLAQLEEELTQSRAHVDLFSLQLEEQCEETENLKVRSDWYLHLCSVMFVYCNPRGVFYV